MRKFIIITVSLLLAATQAQAYYLRTTHNGGPNGFQSVSHTIDDEGNTLINCMDPGYSACPTTVSIGNPIIPVETQEILTQYVYNKVADNNLEGSTQVVVSETTYYVNWEFKYGTDENSTMYFTK